MNNITPKQALFAFNLADLPDLIRKPTKREKKKQPKTNLASEAFYAAKDKRKTT